MDSALLSVLNFQCVPHSELCFEYINGIDILAPVKGIQFHWNLDPHSITMLTALQLGRWPAGISRFPGRRLLLMMTTLQRPGTGGGFEYGCSYNWRMQPTKMGLVMTSDLTKWTSWWFQVCLLILRDWISHDDLDWYTDHTAMILQSVYDMIGHFVISSSSIYCIIYICMYMYTHSSLQYMCKHRYTCFPLSHHHHAMIKISIEICVYMNTCIIYIYIFT